MQAQNHPTDHPLPRGRERQNVAPGQSLRLDGFEMSIKKITIGISRIGATSKRAFVSNSDISLACVSSRLQGKVEIWNSCVNKRAHSRMIIFPNPYQCPPAPTSAESLTLLASALSAFRTRELNGGGTVKST